MAIVFKERLKIQQFLIFLLPVLIAISIFIVSKGFFTKRGVSEVYIIPKPIRKIEIDFELLKSPRLEGLQPIEKIIPLETEIGRENPFSSIQP